MATICERCKVVEKQKYWEDFDKHQFFKVMMNDFRRRLRIPVKFVKNLKDSHKLLGHKILTGPSGNSWVVEVKRTEDDEYVFCNDGWETFVKDHCLEDTDLLVFKMNDFTSFDVMIFDSTACEKEDTFFVKKHRNPGKHPDEVTDEHSNEEYGYGDDDTDEEDNIREPIRRKGSESSRGKQNQFHLPQPRKGKNMKQIPVAKQDNRTRKCTPSSLRKMNVEPEEKVPVLSNRYQVPEKEKIRVHQLAPRHTYSVPSVLMTMQPTHVNMGQLKLPKAWHQKYMRQKPEAITLRIPSSGRRWTATINCRKEGLVIQSGWEDFVRDNGLEEIDICVFELAQGGKHNLQPVVLDVYIYRVENEIMLPYSNSTS